MKKVKPIAINFYGGPGSGKSTMAAAIFSTLKTMEYNCELVTEFAKDKVWEEAHKVFECQLYVCANQVYKMFVVSKHVEVIITDSPIIMGAAYTNGDKLLDSVLKREYDKYNNVDIYLNRVKKYNPNGRYQNEKEAKEKDILIKKILKKNDIEYKEYDGDYHQVPSIINHIEYSINHKEKR